MRWGRNSLTLFCLLLLSGCVAQISQEKLLPGIESLRTQFDVSVEFSDTINQTCRQRLSSLTGRKPDLLVSYGACSVVYPDSALTGRPTCLIILPHENWHEAMEHEIFHCMGFAHQ